MNELAKYIIALSNLYGMVHKEMVVDVFNNQNKEKINIEEVENYLKNPPNDLENEFIHPHKDYFVHESILEFDEFDLLLSKKSDKPYYVPNKKELLNYVDEFYFEKNREYKKVLNYIRKNFSYLPDYETEEIAEEIHDICQFDFNIQRTFNFLNRRGMEFESEKSFEKFVFLIVDLSNNTRLWENNGFTPSELVNREKFNFNKENKELFVREKKKIGRNEPCPCGSGKKYKKCCLDKDELVN